MNFYTAQICLNGHARSSLSKNVEKFCSECGAETIQQCPNCKNLIRGKEDIPGVADFTSYHVPKYCYNCGRPYPWTQSKLDAMKEFYSSYEKALPSAKEPLKLKP